MNNNNFTSINGIMEYLTNYLYKHGYEVEMSCINTFEADNVPNLEHYQYYNEIKER